MFIQIPEGTPTDYATGLNLVLWEIVIFLLFIMLPISYANARNQTDFKNLKIAELGQGWFGFFYAGARLLFILALKVNNGDSYDDFTLVAYLLSMIGLSILIFTYEVYRLGRKAPIFTLIGVLSSFFTISGFNIIPGFQDVDREIILTITSIASSILLVLIASLYLKIMNRFPGQTRTRTSFEFYGLLLFVLSIVFDGQVMLTNPANPYFFKMIFPGVMAIFGVAILISAHSLPKWFFMTFTVIASIVLFGLFMLHLSELSGI